MPHKLVIDRERWLRGPYAWRPDPIVGCVAASFLLRQDDERLCCIGFYYRSLGVAEEHLAQVAGPNLLNDYRGDALPPEASWLLDESANSSACEDLMRINDYDGGRFKMREQEIQRIFAEHGVDVEFTGPRLPIVDDREGRYEDAEDS